MTPILYEIPIVYALLALCNRTLFPEIPGFYGVDPHPYWLTVLLFSHRYGQIAGTLSGVAAAALYLGTTWWTLERYLFADAGFYLLPSLFILVGYATGAVISHARHRQRELGAAVADAERHTTASADELRMQQQIIAHLEERIVTNTASFISVYEGARAFSAMDETTLLQNVVRYITQVVGAEAASLYVPDGEDWRVAATAGWPAAGAYPASLPAHTAGLLGAAARQQRVLSVRDFSDSVTTASAVPAMIAGPLRLPDTGEALGVVAIHKIPFLKLTGSTVTLCAFVLEWAGRAIEQSRYVHRLQAEAIIDPQWQVHTAAYLYRRGTEEFARSQRYYLPLSWARLTVTLPAIIGAAQRRKIRYVVGQLCRHTMRHVDLVGCSAASDDAFELLWITTPPHHATAHCQRLVDECRTLLQTIDHGALAAAGARIECAVAHFTPQCAGFDALIAGAQPLEHATDAA